MAHATIIHTNRGMQFGVNIDDPVGHNGKNYPNDVKLVQGMLQYINRKSGRIGLFGLEPSDEYEIPTLTGSMDGATYSAISEFQIRNKAQLYMGKYADGVIHPARYKNRHLNLSKPLMTITLLHYICWDLAMMSGEDYIEEIQKMSDDLDTALMHFTSF